MKFKTERTGSMIGLPKFSTNMHKELLGTISRLAALETRTQDVKSDLDRVESKMDRILESVSRLQSDVGYLRSSVKSEIMGDIKADLARAQVYLDLQSRNLIPAND